MSGAHTAVTVRRMTERDAAQAARLEGQLFSDPWSEAMILSGMAAPAQRYLGAWTREGILAGYAALMTVPDEWELLRIGVAPELQRNGIASILMETIFQEAAQDQVSAILLEVRKGNTPAVSLYERYGFFTDGVRPGYYTRPREDALLMRRIFPRSDPQGAGKNRMI